MSHPRIRKKTAIANDCGLENVIPAKPACDALHDANITMCTGQYSRARSRNKLPNSLRYDLENALVNVSYILWSSFFPCYGLIRITVLLMVFLTKEVY